MAELNSMALLERFKGDKWIVSYWECVQQPCREGHMETTLYKEVTDMTKATRISMCTSFFKRSSHEQNQPTKTKLSEHLLRKRHGYTTDVRFETLIHSEFK